jgi:hypothetical protein
MVAGRKGFRSKGAANPWRQQTTCTGGIHARIRRAAGFAPSIGFAGHAGATVSYKLRFGLDHSMWAAHDELQ